MATQKAWRLHSYGGPECLKLDDVPVPTPGKGQVRVAVSKAGINPIDWKIREGYVKDHFPLPLPAILGVDFAGTVVAVGEDVSRLKVGDRVMTFSQKLGAFAESIVVDENIVTKVPDKLSDVEAASLPIPALTAWQTLHADGAPKPGMTILVNGASGIVGAFAVQFAKAAGAKVVGIASGKNRNYVMDLGADEFIDYQTEKFEDRVSDIDLILDYIQIGGAEDTTNRSWSVLKPGGAIVSAADPMVPMKTPEGYRGYFPNIVPDVARLEMIADQMAAGKIRSKIAKVFECKQLVEAVEMNKAGGNTGRLEVDFVRTSANSF